MMKNTCHIIYFLNNDHPFNCRCHQWASTDLHNVIREFVVQ